MKSLLRSARTWLLRPSEQKYDALSEQIARLNEELRAQRLLLEDSVRGSATSYLDEIEQVLAERQLGFAPTLELIAKERLSFARFGDGEFKSMLRPSYNLRFQPGSPELAQDLMRVFLESQEDSRCLVGFPTLYRDLHWSRVWIDIWPEVRPLAKASDRLGNAHVSRPIAFQTLGQKAVDLWREVWTGRHVTIITGQNSRMTLLPELFDCAESIDQIESLAVNAYSDLDRVVQEVNGRRGQDRLFLIALGPAGTILASRLSSLGEQAVDIGHISDSYETVFKGAAWPEKKPLTRS
ncbi:GT-D fold domain-containing glycosyltransferase [Leucobacter luti]|uniref:GT-D fold domain-containing glycosyltransferase n=1 Tax=Leucobacter luti TaxID=340320 RepID=UPI003CFC2201